MAQKINLKDQKDKRTREAVTAANAALRAIRAGDFEAASTHAGMLQRRTRLLAGKPRGG